MVRKADRHSPVAQAILDKLNAHIEHMQILYGDATKDALEALLPQEKEKFNADRKKLDRLVFQAARAGLRDHSLVQPRVKALRALGQWNTLRKAKCGLERGVKRPWKEHLRNKWVRPSGCGFSGATLCPHKTPIIKRNVLV